MTAPSEPLPLVVGSQLVPQARSARLDASRFKSVPYSTRVDCHSYSPSKVGSKLNRRFKPLSKGSESQEPVLDRRSRPRSARFKPIFH